MVTLNKGERSILATFPSATKAQKAAKVLQDAGFEVRIDMVSKYPRLPDENYNDPVAGQAASLSALTLNGENGSTGDVGPLLASDTSVSGLSSGDGLVRPNNNLVTVVTSEKRVEEAVSLLKQYGGKV